jgi:dihydrolipoamide dehydrogenase
MSTAVIEKDAVGGRCLNYACIPAKAVLRVADILHDIDEATSSGISVPERSVDFAKVARAAQKVVKTLTGGRRRACSRRTRSTYIEGTASVTDDGNVKVGGDFDGSEIEARKCVILATGSVPRPIPGTQFGGRIIGTEEAWALDELPKRLAVVGAGASARRSPPRTAGSAARCCSSRRSTACCPRRTPTSPRRPCASSPGRT